VWGLGVCGVWVYVCVCLGVYVAVWVCVCGCLGVVAVWVYVCYCLGVCVAGCFGVCVWLSGCVCSCLGVCVLLFRCVCGCLDVCGCLGVCVWMSVCGCGCIFTSLYLLSVSSLEINFRIYQPPNPTRDFIWNTCAEWIEMAYNGIHYNLVKKIRDTDTTIVCLFSGHMHIFIDECIWVTD